METKTPNIDELQRLSKRLVALLAEPHPGLLTWREALAGLLSQIGQFDPVRSDLYAALQAIRDSPQFRDRLENGIQQMVHAALAKARGE